MCYENTLYSRVFSIYDLFRCFFETALSISIENTLLCERLPRLNKRQLATTTILFKQASARDNDQFKQASACDNRFPINISVSCQQRLAIFGRQQSPD